MGVTSQASPRPAAPAADVVFEELPPVQRTQGSRPAAHTDIANALRARPKSWAFVGTRVTAQAAAGAAYRIRTGALVAFQPAGSFRAKARGRHVYAQFRGGAE
ncbi:hypothetical protein ACN20G_11720 [Streptomyces sp. BI20]|uniref:hypothetical protein n=1 Tax=Streptomyces sp. BI20 TaxID=3403460 RepID=UPI003C7907C1